MAPIVIVVILAFSDDGYLRFPPTSLSLQWFAPFFGNMQRQRALLSSLIIRRHRCTPRLQSASLPSMRFCAARFRGKKLLLPLMLSPVVVPSIITAISMYYLG